MTRRVVIHVADSKIGWAKGIPRAYCHALYRSSAKVGYKRSTTCWCSPQEPLAAERLAQNLLRICSASPLKSFEQLLDESLVPSSVTISAVRLRRSSLLEELGEVHSSVSVILPMIESDEPSRTVVGRLTRSVASKQLSLLHREA